MDPICLVLKYYYRSLVPLGRESASFVPKESPIDQILTHLYETKGQHNFGEVFQLPSDATGYTHSRLIYGAVVPRDILRRDETKQILFGVIVNSIKKILLSDIQQQYPTRGLVLEAIDGSTP